VIITLQVAIGAVTPPFGCNIFTAVAVFRRRYVDVVRGSLPFVLLLVLVSGLLILFPQIALFLRDLAFGK
jgi:TRAP-type C4-dicarboxylate transport system permease large subunit